MSQEASLSTADKQLKQKKVKRNSGLHHILQYKALYLMFMPGVIFLLINNYIPMLGISIAFKNVNYTDGILGSPWVGWTNFKFLFSTSDAWIITRNTMLYNALFIVLNLVFGVGLAIMFNEIKNRIAGKVYQSIIFLPYFLSMIIVGYIVLAFLGVENGFINRSILGPLGIEPVDWYSENKYWPYILPLVNTWKSVGYFSLIYLAAIIGFDSDYYEASTIDGASRWHQIRYITIPLLYPMIIITTLLAIGRIFYSDFGLFFQVPLNSGAIFPTTNVIDTYVYRTFQTNGDIGMSSAAGFYQAVVGMVLVLTTNALVRKYSKENALF